MKAIIDRIEGTIAVLIPQDDEAVRINLPLSSLPPGCQEGDILVIGIKRDTTGTWEAREQLSRRIDRLKNNK